MSIPDQTLQARILFHGGCDGFLRYYRCDLDVARSNGGIFIFGFAAKGAQIVVCWLVLSGGDGGLEAGDVCAAASWALVIGDRGVVASAGGEKSRNEPRYKGASGGKTGTDNGDITFDCRPGSRSYIII
jgi:hypothetical protein